MEDEPEESYSYDQWDEDRVDLSFRTVTDLQHLLTARDLQLDYQLFKQSVMIHALLRKELNSVTIKPLESQELLSTISYPSDNLSTTSQAYESFSPSTSSDESSKASITDTLNKSNLFSTPISSLKSSTNLSKDSETILSGSINSLSPITTDGASPTDYLNILTSGDLYVYSITGVLLCLLFLLFILIILIILRFKSTSQRKNPVKILPLLTSYIEKRSIQTTIVSKTTPTQTVPDQIIFPQSPLSILQNSPFYSPVNNVPHSSFSTFRPPDQDKNSPEGRSCGEADQGLEKEPCCVCLDENRGERVQQQQQEGEDKKHAWSSNDRDEGIESEEDINLPVFKELILSTVGEERGDTQYKEGLYAKINYKSKRYGQRGARDSSLESPSISLCSEGNTLSQSPPTPLDGECLI